MSIQGQDAKLSPGGYVQATDRFTKIDQRKALSLTAAIEQGLRANYDQNQRDFSLEVLDLTWEDTKEAFWLPQLQLNLNAGPQRVARLKAGQLGNQGYSRRPTGNVGISMADYTVFNWGKDYLAYLNSKESYRRSNTVFKEQKRALKHSIIIKYFELAYFNRVVQIYRRQLRHASFVYRFNREKVSIRKVSKQEYYQSRSEYLRAQNSFQDATRNLKVAEEQLAFLITDPPSTRYILKDQLDFQRIQMPMADAVGIAKENNPEVRESNKDVKNAKRSYQIQLRENLPLPKFTVNLGAYNHTFAPGVHTTRYNSGLTGNQIDVVATINATWSITGVGGFLNQRTTRRAFIDRSRSFSELTEARHKTQSDIQRAYYKIKTYEQQIRILEAASVTNTTTFDVVLENYLNRKTPYINFQDSLLEAVASDIGLAELYFAHTREKVLLAQEMGVDEFPGKSFESLAKPAEVK
jgi:outer membrane protein TolC